MKDWRVLIWCEAKNRPYTFEQEYIAYCFTKVEAEMRALDWAKKEFGDSWNFDIIEGETFILDE